MYANGKDTAVRNEANGGALNSLVVWIEEKKKGGKKAWHKHFCSNPSMK